MAGARLDGVLSLAYKEYFSSRNSRVWPKRKGSRTGEIVTSEMMPPFGDPVEKAQYDDLLRKLQVEHLLGAIIFREHHRMSYVSVLRPGQAGPSAGGERSPSDAGAAPSTRARASSEARGAALRAGGGDGDSRRGSRRDPSAGPLRQAARRQSGRIRDLAAKDGLTLGPEGLTATTREETCVLRASHRGRPPGRTGGPSSARTRTGGLPPLPAALLLRPRQAAQRAELAPAGIIPRSRSS